MSESCFSFELGEFECFIVNDGPFTYPQPGGLLFVNAPNRDLEPARRKHGLGDEYVSPYPSLVIKTGKEIVLVDTGAGRFGPETGRLTQNLAMAGFAPKEITTVILTHGHPDHIGGTVDQHGRAAFPNARYVMWRQEWDFWTGEPDLSSLAIPEHLRQVLLEYPKTCLPPIQDRIALIDEEVDIVPGIRILKAPGHTPGHIALSVSSRGERLYDLVDAAIHPIHLEHPEWYAAVDLLPDETVKTRRRLLRIAAEGGALVKLFHFPFPGLGRVVNTSSGWEWRSSSGGH